MASGAGDKKVEKSSWASAVDSINPWAGSRSTTPTPKDPVPNPPQPTNPGDHSVNPIYGISSKKYPPDCPPLKVQWFHAVDVPKRKPQFIKAKKKPQETKTEPQPKKFNAFSPRDSQAIELAYQEILEEAETRGAIPPSRRDFSSGSRRGRARSGELIPNTSIEAEEETTEPGTRVPVNEDFLFDVDIENRELAPAYWLGPIYDVRRGSWFYQEGSTLRPCEENLAAQLEEGYLKCKPWRYPAPRARSNSGAKDVTPQASSENLKTKAQKDAAAKAMPPPPPPETHRLFGAWMNSITTYQDSTTAWISSEGVLSWVASTMYERFGGGGYTSGVKVVRGYTEPGKAPKDTKDTRDKETKRPTTPTGTNSSGLQRDERQEKILKRRSAPPSTRSEAVDAQETQDEPKPFESRNEQLKRQLSSLIENENRDAEEEEEAVRKREEKEIQDDYNARAGETQGREIEHLILVTHGIGQLLGLRMESVNFVHDVNTLRKTLKSVYTTSADLRALNSEIGEGPGNCRIQVLPVCWRHLLDFPKKREEKKGEQDIGEATGEEDEYPSLEDITIEGVAFARSLISDLALDVLLYQSAYREQISEIVYKESNRIYKLFLERNPGFKGKVHVMGHSLGSAIMFDILCRQKEKPKDADPPRNPLRFWPAEPPRTEPKDPRDLSFDFDCDDFYCLGSPIGLFQMLKGRTISARHLPNALPSDSPLNPEYMDDPFLSYPVANANQRVSPITGLPYSISSPKVSQLFNVFHPSDPISYRLEPLISPAMSSLKPQMLPYTKKGIFGSVAPQGLTGIGAKVGQSVSGLWSSLSAGIANNLLNRSLGLTQEDVANFTASASPQHTPSPGAGTNISTSAGVISDTSHLSRQTDERKKQLAEKRNGNGGNRRNGNDMTLIDDDLETLYSQFQKKRIDLNKTEDDTLRDKWVDEEKKATRLRREEMKVRALNRNGRVDYSIQESVLDFNPINTIASHMCYWADEDVSHFVMSQLLSKKQRSGSDNGGDVE